MPTDRGPDDPRRPVRTKRGAERRRASLGTVIPLPLVLVALLVGWRWNPAAGSPAVPEAQQTYLADCAACHGADGTGTARGPSLEVVGAASVDYQLTTGRMPIAIATRAESGDRSVRPDPQTTPDWDSRRTERHAPAYPPDLIEQLTSYVVELTGGGGPAVPVVDDGDVAHGGELYRLNCAACHEWAGTGGALVDREAPSLDHATPVQVVEALRIGPGRMPAFGEAALSSSQADDVAAYVGELQSSQDRGGSPLGHLGPVGEGAAAGGALAVLLLVVRAMGERG